MNLKKWYQIVHEILVTLNYIRKTSAAGLTPAEARKPENLIKVKGYMEGRRKDTRKYPQVKVGDFGQILWNPASLPLK